MTYDILATGSGGNAVVINGEVLIDCGAPYKTLEKSGYVHGLRLVLLTHSHGDHFQKSTVRRLHQERPALRWGCCEWMVPHLLEAVVDKRVIDVYSPHGFMLYPGGMQICPEPVPHDVPNCGYRIIDVWDRLFYATDASTIDHIEAKNYDYYMIEANHTRAEIEARIADKLERGEFAYEHRAAMNHISREQALDWLARNAGPNSQYVFLHQHKEATDGD